MIYNCGECRHCRQCMDGRYVCMKDKHVIKCDPTRYRLACSDPSDELLAELYADMIASVPFKPSES